MHHSCTHVENDMDHPLLGQLSNKPTMVGMGYDGRYRCCECKRVVPYKSDDPEQYQADLTCAPRLEPPYPDGVCGGVRES